MPTLDDVSAIALTLPDATEGLRHDRRTWFVGKKGFVWERPFTKADLKRFAARSARPAVAVAAVVVLLLAGCSGSDEGSDPSTAKPTPTTGAKATTTSTPGVDPAPAVAVIAHRGASGLAPEHTFASYDRALKLKADYLELDLQLSADDQLVVIHDPTLDRTIRGPADGCSGKVSDHPMRDLVTCDAGSWFNEANPAMAEPAYEQQHILDLDDVFDRYGPDARYYIEIKAPDEQPAMEAVLVQALEDGGLLDRLADAEPEELPPVIVQSFSADSLRRIHERLPDLPLIQLLPGGTDPISADQLDDIATYANGIGPSVERVDESLVKAAHQRCLVVHPYTVNEVDQMKQLIALGVDGMFTNRPDRLAAARPDRRARPCHR